MLTFLAVVHKDENSAFGVHFPDLPGCFSGTDESNDLIPVAMEALELWFEHEPFVAPSSIEDIRARASDDLREGAFLIAVPAPGRFQDKAA
jgi:predicted RNase H-like HicB family nuclease